MADFPKYDSYKDSGVEWLGEIPSHWNVKKLKFCCANNRYTLREDTDPQLQIRYIDIGAVSQGKIEKLEHHSFKDAPSRARRLAKKGDTIVSTVRTYLRAISYIDQEYADCVFSTGFSVLSPNSFFDNRFFSYLLQSELFINEVVRHSKGVSFPAITSLELGNFCIAIPLLDEQKRIAKFLDRKTCEIDQAIAQKQHLIELLQEQKAILINQAVTKGLDPNVPMCDRGVEWLCKIPSHWDVKKLKFCCANNSHTLREDTDPQLQMRYVDIGSVSQGKIEKVEYHSFKDAPSRARRLSKEGDTIVSTVRTYLKAISYIKQEYADCVFSTGFCILSPNSFFDNRFFSYLLQSEGFINEVVRHSKGVSFPAITPLELGNFSIGLPLFKEQKEIVKFLDCKTSETDQAIAHEQRFIKLLQEQKNIFVSQAVTGKIKV